MTTFDDNLEQQFRRIASNLPTTDERIQISIPNAKEILLRALSHFCEHAQWLQEYDKISQWLLDNRKRGLLCFGNCGRGKTLITQRIFPTLLSHYHRKYLNTVTAVELNDIYDDISRCKLISVDDVGTEPESVIYGERHWRFSELVDAAERDQKLLIVSTNLTLDELRQRYGERTFDRLRAITTTVCFSGPSLRK